MKRTISIVVLIFCIISKAYTAPISFKSGSQIYTYEELNKVDSAVAVLILIDGGAGYAKNILKECKIPNEAVKYNIQCIGFDFTGTYVSDSVYEQFKVIVNYALDKYKILIANVFIGGFSSGGYAAIRLTEIAVQRGDSQCIPNAVFAIDPPLDFFNLYEYCVNEINNNCDNEQSKIIGKNEANWIKNDLDKNLGNPKLDSINYIKNSCYSACLSNGGNAKYLMQVPINMIHEIDIMWKIKERCRDLRYSNVLISSMMINVLYNQGNRGALITTTNNLGYRANGSRNPHSWSIAESKSTLDWMMKYMKK